MRDVDAWVTGACALIVGLHAIQRYNTPASNRMTTTRRLFLASGAGYVAASLVLYGLLSEIVLKPGMLHLLGIQDVTKLLAQYTAPPVLAAVVLTTLLPQVPMLKAADAYMLAWFQKRGRIPSGVSDLADELTLARLVLSDTSLDASRSWVTRDVDVPSELASRLAVAAPDTPQGALTALVVLHRGVEALVTESRYRAFSRKNAAAWQRLRSLFHVFAAQSQAFFVLFEQLEPRAGDDASGAALKRARAHYFGIAGEVHRATAEFLAQGLLAVEDSGSGIRQQLRRLAFTTEEIACPTPPIGALVFMGTMVVVALLGIICLVPPPAGSLPPAMVAVVIGTTQTCALLFAALPKLRWMFFRRAPDGSMPFLGWLFSAAAAFAVSLVIDRGSIALVQRDLHAALAVEQYPLSPSAFMAFGLALTIGMLCDLEIGLGRVRRLLEGVLAGAAMMLCIGLCLGLLQLPSRTEGVLPFRIFPFALSFGLGFVAGAIVPHLYRVARHGVSDAAPAVDVKGARAITA